MVKTVWMKKDEDGDEKRIQCVVCAVGAGQCSGRLRRKNNLTNKEGWRFNKAERWGLLPSSQIEDDRLMAGKRLKKMSIRDNNK